MKSGASYIDDDETTLVFTPLARQPATRSPEATQDRLWDANDVARYLKVSRSWVYHRAEAGLLPVQRVGGLLRFAPAAIRAFAVGDTTDDSGRPEPRAVGRGRSK
jgi:excisionase family DNA binding protein